MRRSIGVVLLLFAFLMLFSLPAAAQPTRGDNSTEFGDESRAGGRNDAGYGGGPHCHNVNNEESTQAYPSHEGHANAGGDVFTADSNCDGTPDLPS